MPILFDTKTIHADPRRERGNARKQTGRFSSTEKEKSGFDDYIWNNQ